MRNSERLKPSERVPSTVFGRPTAATHPTFPRPKSNAFSSVLDRVARYAANDAITIVLEGESGTGKNWLARLAHQQSRRASHELHEISVATIVDSLANSELFGHEAGAYTDARGRRTGAFQSANHSTLFIDEIGKASSTVQRLLLRAIEDGVINPLGSDRCMKVDVRLILATNVSLTSLVADELFLPDLFARLGQFRIQLPPLRERKEDIPDLARYFVAKHGFQSGYPVGLPTIHPSLMNALVHAEWPYNVRELDQTLNRIVFDAESAVELTFDHCVGDLGYLRVHTRGRPTKSSPSNVANAVKRIETVAGAARSLGMSRSTVYRKLAQIKKKPEPPIAQ